jgi:hypothetical protein
LSVFTVIVHSALLEKKGNGRDDSNLQSTTILLGYNAIPGNLAGCSATMWRMRRTDYSRLNSGQESRES